MSATLTDPSPKGRPTADGGPTTAEGSTGRSTEPDRPASDRSCSQAESVIESGSRTEVGAAADQAPGLLRHKVGMSDVGNASRSKVGGVAPFVPPTRRMGRRLRMREWNRRGFVALSPGKQKLRHRILPRTVIGIAFMLMSFGVGGAFAGASFYAYYDDRLAENEQAVARFVEGFDQQFNDAAGLLDEMRVDAVTDIRSELSPLGEFVADANGVVTLPSTAGSSVWLLETRDEAGEIVSGSAFAVVGHEGGTALVTSYELIKTSTVAPSPAMDLLKDGERIPAQLWSWDVERDLALVVTEAEIPTLELAGEREQLDAVGSRVFAISGFGGQGATASPGVLLDHSRVGLQHTAPVGTYFRGGPLLTGEGKVVGVASYDYRPFGQDSGDVRQAPDIRGLCDVILDCADLRDPIFQTGDAETETETETETGAEAEAGVAVATESSDAPPRGEGPVRTEEEEVQPDIAEDPATLTEAGATALTVEAEAQAAGSGDRSGESGDGSAEGTESG